MSCLVYGAQFMGAPPLPSMSKTGVRAPCDHPIVDECREIGRNTLRRSGVDCAGPAFYLQSVERGAIERPSGRPFASCPI
jgi:hypothetical protein